jgi:arylformamidase
MEPESRAYGAFSRRELDDQYDTSKQLPDGDVGGYFDRFVAASELARRTCAFETIRYGPHERESYDFFAGSPAGPLFVWVHGGYWRRLSKDAFSFIAPPLVAAGVSVAILNYPLAPGPTLDAIVASVRAGFVAAAERACRFGGDPSRVFAGGHSVGAQLAAMLAASSELSGMLALSGLYDLEPLRHSHINEWIAMDAATARRNSPLYRRPLGTPWLLIAAGGKEQPEFHRQQRTYATAWRAWGGPVRELAAPDDDHFSIVLRLADEGSEPVRALLELIGARSA